MMNCKEPVGAYYTLSWHLPKGNEEYYEEPQGFEPAPHVTCSPSIFVYSLPCITSNAIITYFLISINNLRSQLYSSVLYYTSISRHVSADSKPSSGIVAYRILKVSNTIFFIICNLFSFLAGYDN
jgi:hypothetical protein